MPKLISSTEELEGSLNTPELHPEGEVRPTAKKPSRKRVPSAKQENDGLAHPVTPLAIEILDNLAKFPHCILLTRVGQFYESYFAQAVEVARLLNIKLTSKKWGRERVPMCGFPIIHLNKHLKTLVQDNTRFVAMCEEFMRSRTLGPKGGFVRRVTRIVTPGTLIDEPFLNQYENNFLLAVYSGPSDGSENSSCDALGLAWMDVSTGEFFAKDVSVGSLRDELARISPKEVVLADTVFRDFSHPVRQITVEEGYFVSSISPPTTAPKSALLADRSGSDDLTSQAESCTPAFQLVLTNEESGAVQLLTAFLHVNLMEHTPKLSTPSREAAAGRMQIDAHTIKSLELRETIREGGTAGSLLSVIKHTATNGGTRLLARWICSPSVSLPEIQSRQSLVAFFLARPHLRNDLSNMLSELEDSTRVVQKLLLGRGDATDLKAVSTSVRVWNAIKARVELEKKMESRESGLIDEKDWVRLDALFTRICDLGELAGKIDAALSESGSPSRLDSSDFSEDQEETTENEAFPAISNFKGLITGFNSTVRPEYSETLTRLHGDLTRFLRQREELERRFQTLYFAPSLTLRSSPGHGMHVHIARSKRDAPKIKGDTTFIPISESATTCTFFNQEWSQLGAEIVRTTVDITIAERQAFEELRKEINEHEQDIRRNARITDELDVIIAFAILAHEMHFCRPELSEDKTYHVVDGRHPTVELGLLAGGRTFVPNTVTLESASPFHVITGPNMAGKSTLLRQTALIAILAQTGSFVPASSARIGIIDAIFSRVGANDDLFRNRSTFMVEMTETAEILKRATPNSLVIMDEVGRGTSVQDGLAIAFSTIHHLITVNQSRTLFATHFHELADLLGCSDGHGGDGLFDAVRFFHTDVDKTEDGYFAYSHRLKPGVNRDSHGLKVAQLAGMPESVISVAQAALDSFRDTEQGWLKDQAKLRALGQVLSQK
ncbi:hypothetical protein PHLGIDRAFT_113698 [Phlebiopsis gigantea 11061_1 CR5-6]|uniref:DNA mismatch repair proteins mutS family domain-containing protein n=1 Tax=Phlebiopsis gigantea (strain 11061_1 CR5-6) TaxID=745531 RepID=A0A0C3SEC7_PHLG1|nr:hypothetical protein PHLGIDRAFT_113698 [Phlebiopsis gigantea 11061_1 CR5-6]